MEEIAIFLFSFFSLRLGRTKEGFQQARCLLVMRSRGGDETAAETLSPKASNANQV